MCVYCNMGSHTFEFDPPWYPPYPDVRIPKPRRPVVPWDIEKLQKYLGLLKQIKALEDSVGCPCPEERDKPDYVAIFEQKIADMEGDS